MVGAAAMRQVAEDASAHSAVEEGPFSYFTNMWETSSLRSAAEEVAKKNFPEFERQDLIEEVMKAHQHGELDEEKLKRSWDEKSSYLFATMKIMKKKLDEKRLRSAAEEVAKNFPEEERQYLTEAVMKAHQNGELDEGKLERSWDEKSYSLYLFQTMKEKLDENHLRSEIKKLAKGNFPWGDYDLTEEVMKAFKNGEMDKGLKEKSQEEKQRYLLKTMREEYLRREVRGVALKIKEESAEGREYLTEAVMRAALVQEKLKAFNFEGFEKYAKREWLRNWLLARMKQKNQDWRNIRWGVEEVARLNFPEEHYDLTEAVKKAFMNGELDETKLKMSWVKKKNYLVQTMQRLRELPVAASAIKFCSNLFREATSWGMKSYRGKIDKEWMLEEAGDAAEGEAKEAAAICHEVLTGELGRGPKWAKEAAKSSQHNGRLKRGRLEKVNAVEPAWKVSLDNVCRDECHALVEEMRRDKKKILEDVAATQKPPSYEEVCAKRVVQNVEAEILSCCADSCGWNGRACMLWPFLNSTEKGQWEAECCTEFNILKGSSRARMCDSTLTGKENKEVIRDVQPNRPEDRRMIGQDPVGKGTSFLQREEVNEPIPAPQGKCPPPLDLGKIHEHLKDEWKTTVSRFSVAKFFKFPACIKPPPKIHTIGECTAFLPQDVNGPYLCYGECLESVGVDGLPDLQTINAKSTGNTGLLYVHETIHKK